MKFFAGAFAIGLTLTVGVSCGSDSDARNVPLEELPAEYMKAVCEGFEGCLGDVFATFLPGEDCVTRFSPALEDELPRMQAAIDSGRAEYHGDLLDTCLAEVRGLGCSAFLEREPESCQAAFDGTQELGAECAGNNECKGRAYCKLTDSCPGTCSALEQAGGACKYDDQCASGLECSDENQHCVAPLGNGDACSENGRDCALGYICTGSQGNTPGSCRPYADVFTGKVGAACDLAKQQLCEPSLVCRVDKIDLNGATQTCAAHVAKGASCNLAGPDICTEDEYCKVELAALEGTCTPRPKVGEACGRGPFAVTPSVCAAYTRCEGGTCRALAKLGESCTSNDICYSERCTGGACVSKDACEQ